MNEKELLADSITKALATQENGGKIPLNHPVAGKSGEMKSIFQFDPSTWDSYSQQVFGKQMPLNNDTETYVVKHKVLGWLDEGKNTSQIASMWNAGEGRPNAYKENWVGVHTNPDGTKVPYDTPTYAKNVVNYAKQFYAQKSQQPTQSQTAVPLASSNNGLLGSQLASSPTT
jgi:hypothetical protein